ncbi:LacI family DNA-binding transcriptional regulator [Microbacterium sp. No. 7]|uniref:LacI family DNA-binding transcriptional regulator n=1 Tax=Microbacterium sp. No. 7 TaxID=1714373 RepID=UPI0006D0AB09|nr:LacI family DNA-binding transcriptional regulator [Microbacterium sp. No. 7]ALJ21349.1 LacI family transcriptional regulator [Microbacterium sp. No. 7]
MTSLSDRGRAVSQRDVAELAGVSGQTVSRVASGVGAVSEKTRRRVEAAMAELGYRPNVAARALRLGTFRSIGVVVFNLETLGNIRTIGAIAGEAAARGYALEIIQVQPAHAESSDAGVSSALRRLGEDAVDGIIIIIESHIISEASLEFPPGMPSVVVESGARPDRPSVNADQTQGAQLAVEHLLDLGHPTVWHVSGPSASNSASERAAAWRGTLEERGCRVPDVIVGDWTSEFGYHAGLVLARNPEVSAVFAANDQMALGAMHAFHRSGVRVPEDISIVGFDDMAESAQFWPPLTTIHQDFEAAGSLAVSLIIDEIERGTIEPGVRRIGTRLVVRDSTGPYRGPRSPAPGA